MNVRFLTLAQQDVDELSFGLKKDSRNKCRLLEALDDAVRFVEAYPFASTEIEPELRRCLFVGFPYSLIYGVADETIVVIAVAHTHRHPRYWVEWIN